MRVYLGDDLLEFSDDELEWMYVSEGEDARVYQYRGEALKIYKDDYCRPFRLTEDAAIRLSTIHTNRVLLPKRMIRNADDGNFCGYTTPFIKRATTTGIIKMQMLKFMNEVDLLRDEVFRLADHYVDVADFDLKNTAYDGRIYLVDPGSYCIRTTPNLQRYVHSNNLLALNNYVKKEIFGIVNLTGVQRDFLDVIFPDGDYIGDVLRETALEHETVRQYVKRMTR